MTGYSHLGNPYDSPPTSTLWLWWCQSPPPLPLPLLPPLHHGRSLQRAIRTTASQDYPPTPSSGYSCGYASAPNSWRTSSRQVRCRAERCCSLWRLHSVPPSGYTAASGWYAQASGYGSPFAQPIQSTSHQGQIQAWWLASKLLMATAVGL